MGKRYGETKGIQTKLITKQGDASDACDPTRDIQNSLKISINTKMGKTTKMQLEFWIAIMT